jgi:hypothetical protein
MRWRKEHVRFEKVGVIDGPGAMDSAGLAYIESPEAFVVLYRAMYIDGPLAIRGEKDLGGAYVAGAQTPQEFGSQFALYLQEPTGRDSFAQPDENGLRWFADFSDDEQS